MAQTASNSSIRPESSGGPGPVVIKKYANRRLYDTSLSKYVNLDHLAELLRGGVDVQVVEAKSGDDVTRAVLTQIIVEGAKDSGGPPTEFLKDLIRAGDKAQRDFLHWYLSSAAQVYQKVRDGWEQAYRLSPAGRLSEQLRKHWDPSSMVPGLMRGLVPFLDDRPNSRRDASQQESTSGSSSSGKEPAGAAEELAALRRQLDALAAKIES